MTDADLRNDALFAVQRLWRRFGDAVPFAAIAEGFEHRGERILFFSTFEGVYKPAQLTSGVLSVRTTLGSRYEDERVSNDRVWYDYSPKPDRNERLLENFLHGLDLLYFLQVKEKPGVEYLIFAPVRVVDDDPVDRRFLLDLSPSTLYETAPTPAELHRIMERRYGVSEVRTRLFQAHFRRAVLDAYRRRCAVCELPESPVLDGAHLLPEREELGEPRVQNGLSLCALHHRTFDRDLLGVTPDLRVHVFRERLEKPNDETSMDMLVRYHGRTISVPTEDTWKPDRELVELRWSMARER